MKWCIEQNIKKRFKAHSVFDAHVQHRLGRRFDLDHFVVVGRNQPVKGIANETEAEVYARKLEKQAWATSKDLVLQLKILAGLIGSKDIAKTVVFDEKKFNDYTDKVEQELKQLGYELFEKD